MTIYLRGRTEVRPYVLVALCLAAVVLSARSQAPVVYDIDAVRFATVPFRVASLVAGADRNRTIEIAFMVWAIRGDGRTILLDSGFYRDKFLQQRKPANYVRPSDALMAGLGIRPDEVTDIVLSHVHWDHADGLDLFPRARVWIQREEFEYYVGDGGQPLHAAIDPDDAKVLDALKKAGRVMLVDGDDREILSGVRVYTGGKHTYASQYAGVRTRTGTIVLASDNAYLYENLEQHLAIAQTLDAASNLGAQERMLRLAGSVAHVIPGHDPAVFERFPNPGKGIARIQ